MRVGVCGFFVSVGWAFVGFCGFLWVFVGFVGFCGYPQKPTKAHKSPQNKAHKAHKNPQKPTNTHVHVAHTYLSHLKKIPHHDENACYYDPRRGNKNADAPMILQWIALSTMLYRLQCSESATLSRLASNHMLCRHM